MEKNNNNQHSVQQSTLDLIKNEIINFQNQDQNQNKCPRQNLSSVESFSYFCGAILAKKLMKILENVEDRETRTEKTSPDQKAMSNSVVVREISSYLDVHSLLKFRQVSRRWREEATSILSSQRHQNRLEEFLCVKFKVYTPIGNYRHDNGETLEDFLEERALNSGMFIYSGFIFEGGNFQSDSTLLRLFSDFGSRIQHLNLSLQYLDVAQLRQILLERTTNLKSLILDPTNFWEGVNPLKRDQDPSLSLPNLRKITLPKIRSRSRSNSLDLICEILTSAPNLTSIQDPTLAFVPELVSMKKLSLVKSLTWSFLFSTDQVTNLVNFVAASPKLTSLTFRDFAQHTNSNSRTDPRIFPALLSLLDLGQNSLEKVTGVEIIGQHFRIRGSSDPLFPPFPNVTELHVGAEKSALFPVDQILPRGHDLSRIFPELKTLHLKTDKSETYPFTLQSSAHGSLQKLKVSISAFKLTSQHLRQWVEKLGGHYPNITQLEISIKYKGEENIPECLKLIPKYFKNLEWLVLQFWTSKNSSGQPKLEWNLDEALTGFSKETCKTLEEKDEVDPELQKIEVLEQIRTAPSIIDLKNLTNFTFEVQFRGNVQPLWSHVTKLYAFEPMAKRQGLEVNIRGHYTNRFPLTGNDLGPI